MIGQILCVMKTLKEIRNELGLSQKAMAVLLGISRSNLILAEKGSRTLPPKAMEYLEKIEQLLTSKVPYQPTNKEVEFYRQALEKLLRKAERKKGVLVQKLQALENEQQAKIVRLHILDYFARDFEIRNPYSPLVHESIWNQAIDLEHQLLTYDEKLNAVDFEIDGIRAELGRLPKYYR